MMVRSRKTGSQWSSVSASRVSAAALLAACLSVPATGRGQTGIDPLDGVLRPVDVYGNAQAFRPERRALDLYQNDVQRQALGGYLDFDRRTEQRGYGAPFALPGDLLSATVNSFTGAVFLRNAGRRPPAINGMSERQRRLAYGSYGGFGERMSYYAADDPTGIFARRRELITATGLNAPVERAMGRSGALPGLRWSVSRTPFLATEEPQPDSEQAGDAAPQVTLDERLSTEMKVLHSRTRAEGWAFFRDGDYRRAMRSFETAAMLNPQDYESRIGEIFCHITIGTVRTAFTLLMELERRDANPFRHALNVADRYGGVVGAQQVRLTAQGIAESAEQSAEANALHIFVLWYMDRRDDALRAARTLAGRAPGRLYAAWPDRMRAATAASPTTAPALED